MDRAVLDTNVLVSAYVFGGNPEKLLRDAIRGEFELITSPALLAELARILGDRFDFDTPHVEVVIRQLVRVGSVFRPQTRLHVITDEADNRVLECASQGEADTIVTEDAHLLDLGEYEGIAIVKPAAALRLLGS